MIDTAPHPREEARTVDTHPVLSVVAPVYNEAETLPLFCQRVIEALEPLNVPFELVLVNDGSRDGTLRLIQSLAAEDPRRFCVVNLDKNRGKAEAVRRGMLEAFGRKPDVLGFWDADLATPLHEVTEFLGVFDTRPDIEMVFAARVRLLGRSISRNPRRHYVGRVGATLISSSLGLAVYDTQCGAKMFRAHDAMRELFAEPFLSRWLFDVEIVARYVRQRGRDAAAAAIYELPIMEWHDVKGSKVKSTDFLRALKDLWKIHRAYNRRR